MKPKTRFIIILIGLGIILYHLLVNYKIINHPYMVVLFLFVGGVVFYHWVMLVFSLSSLLRKDLFTPLADTQFLKGTEGSSIILKTPEEVKNYLMDAPDQLNLTTREQETNVAIGELKKYGSYRTYIDKRRVTFYLNVFND